MTSHKPAFVKQFSTQNWEYILQTVKEQLLKKGFASQKLLQQEFNKLIEERYNDIAPAHQKMALKIARKFDFMTAHEKKHQYLDISLMRKAN